jgi:MFS transporter, DHA1 family, tetracycline resistance protein
MTAPAPAGSTNTPGRRRAALAFIFITVALDMLALGLVVPVLPKLVVGFVSGNTGRAAEIYGLFVTLWEAMQLVFSPVLGALSDRFGRRPIVLLSNFGLGLDYILMALAQSLPLLLIGRVLSGITSASFTVAGAYIADVTPPEKRAAGFGMLGAAFGLGFVVGPALGGLLGSVHPRLPFWVAAGLSLGNALYGFFILPESLPPERRARFAWARANPFGSLMLLRSQRQLLGLASVTFLSSLAHFVLQSTFVLYASYRYGWTEKTLGLTLAGVGVCSAVVQGALVGPAVSRLGERRAMLLGLLFGAAGFAVYGLAPTGVLFSLGVPVMALWGLSSPAAQALMSTRLGPSEQGQLQGALTCLMGFAGILGPPMFTFTFAAAIDRGQLPGAPFLLSAALLLSAAVVGLWVTRKMTRSPTRGPVQPTDL